MKKNFGKILVGLVVIVVIVGVALYYWDKEDSGEYKGEIITSSETVSEGTPPNTIRLGDPSTDANGGVAMNADFGVPLVRADLTTAEGWLSNEPAKGAGNWWGGTDLGGFLIYENLVISTEAGESMAGWLEGNAGNTFELTVINSGTVPVDFTNLAGGRKAGLLYLWLDGDNDNEPDFEGGIVGGDSDVSGLNDAEGINVVSFTGDPPSGNKYVYFPVVGADLCVNKSRLEPGEACKLKFGIRFPANHKVKVGIGVEGTPVCDDAINNCPTEKVYGGVYAEVYVNRTPDPGCGELDRTVQYGDNTNAGSWEKEHFSSDDNDFCIDSHVTVFNCRQANPGSPTSAVECTWHCDDDDDLGNGYVSDCSLQSIYFYDEI